MHTKDGMDRWSFKVYRFLSLLPCDDLWAVYRDVDESKDYHLEKVAFLAAADVTEIFLQRPCGEEYRNRCGQEYRRETYSQIVEVELSADGLFYVCEEADNYVGLVRTGDDPRTLLGGHSG